MKSWIAIGMAVTFACGLRADNITNVQVQESPVSGGHISGTAVGDNGQPLPAGTPVSIRFEGPNGPQFVQTTTGQNGQINFAVPIGYHNSSFYVKDGGSQSPQWVVRRHGYEDWTIWDPLVPYGTDTWSLADASARTYERSELVGDAFQTRNYDVLAAEMIVHYGSGEGGLFDVSLDSGFLSLSEEHTIAFEPGPLGQIDVNDNTFAFTLTGTFDANPWSMYWEGTYSTGGSQPCPGTLTGSAFGLDVSIVPEPASIALLLLGIVATVRRRRFA